MVFGVAWALEDGSVALCLSLTVLTPPIVAWFGKRPRTELDPFDKDFETIGRSTAAAVIGDHRRGLPGKHLPISLTCVYMRSPRNRVVPVTTHDLVQFKWKLIIAGQEAEEIKN
eukprot:12407493-Karenia_brevis.AAC.1